MKPASVSASLTAAARAGSSSTTSTRRTGERCEVRYGGAGTATGFSGVPLTGSSTKKDAPPVFGRQSDPAAVLLDDRVRDGQAQAGALADFLRREKRVEDLRLQFLRDPRTVVVDLEDDGVAVDVVPAADDESAAAVGREHRLLGVDDQVEQHLLHLVRVGKHLRQSCSQRFDDGDVGDALLVRSQARASRAQRG